MITPCWYQAITLTIIDLSSIWPPGTDFNHIVFAIQTFLFKKIHLKMMSAKFRAVRPQRVNESLQAPEALGSVAADGQGLSKSRPIQLSSSSNHKRSLWSSTQCDHKSTPYHAGASLTGDRTQRNANFDSWPDLSQEFIILFYNKTMNIYINTPYQLNDFCISKSYCIWLKQGMISLEIFQTHFNFGGNFVLLYFS